ncbi:hypothetical protein BHE74_00049309 [Ensete ventricosum]|nr:hypothetical protein GW17_00052502 [Ensete ventricosum]RWW44899.1 hypothetical protein BHE74_00049309 [Ensete ventricosum]RZS06991.1 hypothetical protein BHM03_00037743 [Ensete ventricosum]
MIGAARELDYFSAHIRLREPGKSEDKTEGRTFMESSIPCSHGGRALVMKGAEEVENTSANSQVPGQGRRAEAKELHKTYVNGLLIKITESGRLRVDAGVLNQETK